MTTDRIKFKLNQARQTVVAWFVVLYTDIRLKIFMKTKEYERRYKRWLKTLRLPK